MDPVRLLHLANIYRHEFILAGAAGLPDAQAHELAQGAADAADAEWGRLHPVQAEVRLEPTAEPGSEGLS